MIEDLQRCFKFAYSYSILFIKLLTRYAEKEFTVAWLPEDGISRCRNALEQKSVCYLLYTV
jgi:hypothetical protein